VKKKRLRRFTDS